MIIIPAFHEEHKNVFFHVVIVVLLSFYIFSEFD